MAIKSPSSVILVTNEDDKGIKTEPAFAQLLGLKGDPYEALLGLESKILRISAWKRVFDPYAFIEFENSNPFPIRRNASLNSTNRISL